jgi:hypothetical protein
MLQSRISLAEEYIKFRQTVAFRALIADTYLFCKEMTPQQKEDSIKFLMSYTPTNSDIDLIIQDCKRAL